MRLEAAAVTLWREGDALRYRGPREALTPDALDRLKAHKPDILAALAHPNLPGHRPEFPARLSAEDLEDIAPGDCDSAGTCLPSYSYRSPHLDWHGRTRVQAPHTTPKTHP